MYMETVLVIPSAKKPHLHQQDSGGTCDQSIGNLNRVSLAGKLESGFKAINSLARSFECIVCKCTPKKPMVYLLVLLLVCNVWSVG